MKHITFILIFLLMQLQPRQCTSQTNPWHQTNGPTGGNILDIDVTPAGNILVGTDAGVYISSNQGASWELRSLTPVCRSVTAVTIDSLGVIYSGNEAGALRISTDTGVTWAQIPGVHGNGPMDMLVDSDRQLWVCYNGGGLHRTSDKGTHWESIDSGLTSVSIKCLLPERNGRMFAGTLDAGVFRSSDHGKSWQQKVDGMSSLGIEAMAQDPQVGIMAATWGGLFRSTDAGDHWTQIATHPTLSVIIDSSGAVLAGDPHGAIARSTDGGLSWSSVAIGPEIEVRPLVAGGQGIIFAGTMGSGVYWSSNGGLSWIQRTTGIYASSVRSVIAADEHTVYAALWGSDLVRTTNRGEDWLTVSTAPGNYKLTNLAVDDSGKVLAASWGYGIIRQSAGGRAWHVVHWGYFESLITAPGGIILAGNDVGRVLQSDDYGESWREDSVAGSGIAAIAIESPGVLYAGATPGGVFRSTDNGSTWLPKGNGVTNPYVRTFLILSSGNVLAGTDGGLFRSTDRGDAWALVPTPIVSIRTLIRIGNGVYAGGWGGIAYSSDLGATWVTASEGLWAPEVRSLAADAQGNIYAATPGVGVFVRSAVTEVGEEGDVVPKSAKLNQNYPNPFNPTTVVSYELSEVSNVRLVVYDLLGREVAVLVDGRKEPGSHEVSFDAAKFAGGFYLYRLTAGRFVASRKMLLLH